MRRISNLLLLLASGTIAGFSSPMLCVTTPINLLPAGVYSVSCPGFLVSGGGSITGVAISVGLDAVFAPTGSAIDTSFSTLTGSTFSTFVSGSGFQTIVNTVVFSLGGPTVVLPFTINITSAATNATFFQACYAVDYATTGGSTGFQVGPNGSGSCGVAPPPPTGTPEPSTAWLVLPGLVGYGFTRLRRTWRTTSSSRP